MSKSSKIKILVNSPGIIWGGGRPGLEKMSRLTTLAGVDIVLWPLILSPHPLRFTFDFLTHITSNLTFI